MIGILDYGMGNLKSIQNAVEYLGFDCVVVNSKQQFDTLSHLIVPGVGSYRRARENLENSGFIEPILKHVQSGKPYFGICLGMQLLSTTGTEGGESRGLGLIPGKVLRLPEKSGFSIPHVGWNNLDYLYEHPVFEGIKDHVDFYFVHSYYFEVENESDSLTKTGYCINFTTTVAKDNIVGVQYHPEKSQDNGLQIIDNFCQWEC